MTLAYSVRFSRCSPGGGVCGEALRSSSCSSHAAIDSYVAGSGRGMPAGGIMPARSFLAMSSHVFASCAMLVTSRVSTVSLRAESRPASRAFVL